MSESFTTLVKAIVQKHMLAPSEPVVALLASERGLRIETDRVHWHASTFITTPAFEIISIARFGLRRGSQSSEASLPVKTAQFSI